MRQLLSQTFLRVRVVASSIRQRTAGRWWYNVGVTFLGIWLLAGAKFGSLSEASAAIRHYATSVRFASAVMDPDTAVFFGPKQFVAATSNIEIHFVESFSVPPQTTGGPGWMPAPNQYTIRMQRVGGSLTTANVSINGTRVATAADFASATYIERPITVSQTDPNTNSLTVVLKGAVGAGLVVTVVGIPDATFSVFGPNVYAKGATTPTIFLDNFVPPSGSSSPFTVSARASVAGTNTTITLNGVEVIKATDWPTGVTYVVKTVSVLGGSNSVKVAVRGNTGTTITATVSATDKTPPRLTITVPSPNFVTNANAVAVSGTSQDQQPTQVKVNGIVATMSGAQNTDYSASVPLTEGANTIAIRATDRAGNHTDSTRTVTRDTQAPTLTVTSPADASYTNQDAVTVAGTVTDATAVTVKVNGVSYPVGQGGAFSGSFTLAAGVNFLTITATDAGSNVTTLVRKVTQAKQPPVLTVTSPNDGFAKNTTPLAVSGTVTGTTPITVSVNGVGMTVSGSSFSGSVPLTEGANDIAFTATDPAGNVTVVHRTGKLDTHPPVLAVSTPAAGSYSNAATATVTGTATDASALTVTVNGMAVTLNPDGSFSQSITLVTGANPITVTATDASTNATTVTRTITQDRDPPVPTISTPNGVAVTTPYTNANALTVTVTVMDASPVTVTLNGVPVPPDPSANYIGTVQLTEGVNDIPLTVTDAANNSDSRVLHVVRDTQAPVIDVTSPVEGSHLTTEPVTISGTVHDATADSTRLTINGAAVAPSPVDPSTFNFSTEVHLATGSNAITLVATDGAGNMNTVTRTVTFGGVVDGVPPDPATIAPKLDATVATTTLAATSFLYTGPNPIQTGVAPGTIERLRAGELRGTVKTRAGNALPGVKVTVLDHPEFGQTLSRADGAFDLVVNGGSMVTINYEKDGYLPAQRQAVLNWREYVRVDSVTLVSLDPASSVVDFSQPTQAAQGSLVTDERGTRRATMIFKGGTHASLTMPDGTTRPESTLTVRATEYTVGPTGPSAMPGALPITSAYTYAVELSADEAIAAGATGVVFDRPVPVYIDNFLKFPTGIAVPLGFYDRAKASWIPLQNGRIVKILADGNGQAILDVDGSGNPASSATLTAMGIDEPELAKLADLYQPGMTLWRIQVTHFTPHDTNWPHIPPRGARRPTVKNPDLSRAPNQDRCATGSIIGCERQTLGEILPVAGTALTLNYKSDATPGYKEAYASDIPVADDSLPSAVIGIELEVTIAGQFVHRSFPAERNQISHFVWDGKDVFGRTVQGLQQAHVRVGYVYPTYYADILPTTGFGGWPDLQISSDQGPEEVLWQDLDVTLGTRGTTGGTLGGWSLNVHHSFDPEGRVLYLGDGAKRTGAEVATTATTMAGADCPLFADSGHCATPARPGDRALAAYLSAQGMGLASDGSMYLADGDAMRIWRVNSAGTLELIAGNGTTDFNGDGIPATSAAIYPEGTLRVGPDNSVYFVDYTGQFGNGRVRRVDKNGIISTAAGSGVCGDSVRTGIPATQADLCVYDFTLAKDGTLYVLDGTEVYRVGADGIITRVVGDGSYARCDPSLASYVCAEGKLANAHATFNSINGIAVGPDGSIYLANGEDRVFPSTIIYRIGGDGIIRRIAGNGNRSTTFAQLGNGKPATEGVINSYFVQPAIGPDGTLYFLGAYLTQVDQSGMLRILSGCVPLPAPVKCVNEGGGRATLLTFFSPRALDFGPDARLYILDNFARRIDYPMPSLEPSDVLVASEDGSEQYIFNADGRHLRTIDALVGNTLLTFGYDAAGLLTTITNIDGNVVRVERDGTGAPTAIVAPLGQRTELTLNSANYLATFKRPEGPATVLTYGADGLLKTYADGNGNLHQFTYDVNGLLVRDDDPAGGFKSLVRAATDSSSAVTMTTALGVAITHSTTTFSTGAIQRRTLDGAGLATTRLAEINGTVSLTAANGMTTTVVTGPEPRVGMQAPVLSQVITRTPNGLVATVSSGRHTVLADSLNPMSLVTQFDSLVINGRNFRSTYDAAARTTTTTTPVGRSREMRFDALGRLIEEATPELTPAQYQYDSHGRVEQISLATRHWNFDYDSLGRLASSSDPVARSSQYVYDAADRLTRQVLTGGREVRYAYDSVGNLRSVTPPGNLAHQFRYDAVNLLRSYEPPSLGGGTWNTTFEYDLDRRLTRVIRPDGDTIGLEYDVAGRPSTVTMPGGSLHYTFQPGTGSLIGVSGPYGGALSFIYDGSLLTQVHSDGEVSGTINATYNSDFRVNGLSVNGGPTIDFAYDDDGLITGAGALTITRSAANGFIMGTVLGGVSTSQAYTPQGELAHDSATLSGTALFDATFSRDGLGRITELTEMMGGSATTKGYTYDVTGRLSEVRENGALTATYEYDSTGNRLRVTTPGGVLSATYDAQDRLLSFGNATYTYGRNGELSTKTVGSQVTRYEYDVLGNLRRVTQPDATIIEYVVDAMNRRVGKKVNGVLVQGFMYQNQINPVAELDGTGSVVSLFVYGSRMNVPDYMIKNGVTYRLISDHLGSVRLVVNATSGAVIQRLNYGEWGGVSENTNPGFQPFTFGGGISDEATGLVRFGLRDYDPVTGRWTAKDPVGFSGGDLNLYGFARNDPVNRSDPTGQWIGIDDLTFTVGGAFLGVAGQALGDIFSGRASGWEDYAGAAIGGAAGGEALLYTGPIGAGAIGAAVGNVSRQGLKNLSGAQCGFNFASLGMETVIGGAAGLIPGIPVDGLNAGSGSFNALYKQMVTKMENGQISDMSIATAAKMFAGQAVENMPGVGAAAGAGVAAAGFVPRGPHCACSGGN